MKTKLFCALLGIAVVASGQATGVGNFIHVVANLDKSIEFYHDGIGLELNGDQGPRPYVMNAAVTNLYDAPGELRFAVLKVPDSDMNVEIVEFKNFNSKPATTRLQDPGATLLILTMRDLDSVMARLNKIGAKVVSAGGVPSVRGNTKVVFVRDPDGFFVEMVQRESAPAGDKNVLGIGFGMVVEDTEKTLDFYRDVFGFQPKIGTFSADTGRMATAGTPGAQYRRSTAMVPGTSFEIEFLEFKDIDRKPLHLAIHDPGAGVFRLKVRDLDATAKSLTLVTMDHGLISIGKSRFTMARDLNNLFLEPMQTAP
jgi:catechol 2,3-dioxygenase-like lactoylglutathione lyase family enzyme